MKRLLIAALALALGGCSLVSSENPYEGKIFYTKYLDPANPADQRILANIDSLRGDPSQASVHNELGQQLAAKGFPKDAEREFERAVDDDRHFYPAWYNLGLIRAARGDLRGARFAFGRAVRYKPGHPAALFHLGLLEERRGNRDAAIAYYAKAFLINPAMLDVKVNPRILDTKLAHLALLEAYPQEHARKALRFQPNPANYISPASRRQNAPSPQPPAESIVLPAAPVTDPSQQPAPPPPPGT